MGGKNSKIAKNNLKHEANTSRYLAVQKGDEKIVKAFSENGTNVNPVDTYTSLSLAVQQGDEKVVQTLLENGANVDARDNHGKSILHLAVQKGNLVIVQHILNYGPDVNNHSNEKVLNAAVLGSGKDYSEIVKNLLQNGFTVNSKHVNNYNFFFTAVEKGYLKIVEPLLKYGTDVNKQSRGNLMSPLHVAAKYKQEEVAKLLISYAADVNTKNSYGRSPIFDAIKNGDLNMTKLLLNNRAIVRATPELLNVAQYDVDINTTDVYGKTPLHCTTLKNDQNTVNEEIVELLLSRGANVNAKTKFGLTTFQNAVRSGSVKIVEILLEYVDVNSTFKDEMTSLHLSAQNGNVVISKMLLNKGANVHAKLKEDNWTPLYFAMYNNRKEVIEVLFRCGARVDSKIMHYILLSPHYSIFSTPLTNSYSEIFEILLENGADINFRNEIKGETALIRASSYWRNPQLVEVLLKCGADINIEREDYLTPLDLTNEKTATVLHHHIAKLKAANLYVSRKNELSISGNKRMSDFQNQCKKEILKMNSEKIPNTIASFYDILSTNVSGLALYARNKNIVRALESDKYKKKFSVYSSMIECNFKRGKRRKRLLEGSDTFFDTISNNFPKLPCVCKEKILSYLSDEDLRNLMAFFGNDDGRKELLEQGYRYFHFLFINIPGFSYEFTEKIFSYLSNADLRNLVEACKSDKGGKRTSPLERS